MDAAGKCLICEVKTSEMHRGINCCRACAVFFKRTLARSKIRPLKCKKGEGQCTSNKPKGMCRKCRFERFASILDSSSASKLTEEMKENTITVQEPSTHRPLQTSLSNETQLLERMKKAYRTLCLTRKQKEISAYPSQIRDQLHRGNMKYAPATYTNVVPHAGIMFAGLLDLFSSSFIDFQKLSKDQQQQLLYPSFELMNRSDDIFRAIHCFPDDDTFMPSYTTVFSIDKIDDFLSDCPPGVNKAEARAEIIKNTKRSLVVNKAHFKRVQLTLEEFLAFIGLALWQDQEIITDDKMIEMQKRNREDIMAELHKYYAANGKSDYSARLGDLLCLLVSMEELAVQHKEDQKVYMLMNMFNEYMNVK